MGVSSNLELVFLPKKHPKDHRLVMETPNNQERVEEQKQEKQPLNDTDDDHVLSALISLDLKIKIPSYEEAADDEDGLKTPTSPKHRIPEILPCPPAPRKPKSQPSKKRKDQFALDLSQEIESFFSSQLNAAAENKKIKVFTN